LSNTDATILIVDDEPVNLDTICSHLQQDNYELVRAGNGREAWSLLESDPEQYDVVILDRGMPDINALQLLDNIRQHDAMGHVPVVMQTVERENHQVAEGLRAGAYYYLTRPYDRDTVKSVVRSAVDNRLHEKSLQQSLRAGRKIFELMSFGRLRIHDLQECNLVASQVAHLCPDPQRVVSGIAELLVNALEHGNLKIGYAEKSRLMRSGLWQGEIERRLAAPDNAGGFVELEFDVSAERIQIRVRDRGEGFDWRPYLDFDPARAFDPHGRGIAVARKSSFDDLEYIGNGNEVVATVSKRPHG
jgi:DNA-binding response OmpR family regulator